MGNNAVGVGLDVDVVTDEGNPGNLLGGRAGDVDGGRAHGIGRRPICTARRSLRN